MAAIILIVGIVIFFLIKLSKSSAYDLPEDWEDWTEEDESIHYGYDPEEDDE